MRELPVLLFDLQNKRLKMLRVLSVLSLLVCFSGSSPHSIADEQETASAGWLEGILQQFGDASLFELLPKEPDLDMTPVQMIEFRGFKAELHHAVTEDCYILELHRVVSGWSLRH